MTMQEPAPVKDPTEAYNDVQVAARALAEATDAMNVAWHNDPASLALDGAISGLAGALCVPSVFSDMVPALRDFHRAIAPTIKEALELYGSEPS